MLPLCAAALGHQETASLAGSAMPVDYRFSVETPNGTPVDVAVYNKMMEAQGLEHYCDSGRCDRLPELLAGEAPVYPLELIGFDVTGQATVVFTIDESGSVVDPVVESATNLAFSEASLRAIRTWKFRPASLEGKPVRQSSRQQFPFELQDKYVLPEPAFN
ncbi:TonB family C-terminal domain-containing protein [Pseudoxanthomonas sp. GM95]|nr:TonB family C-terminal domain-containing protein [Pseudoxanthomonas sp. GM95]